MQPASEEETPLLVGNAADQYVKSASIEARLGFIRKVYGILSVQLLLTVAIAFPIWNLGRSWVRHNPWVMFVSLGGMILLISIQCCCQQYLRQYPTNYIILFVFTLAMSIAVGVSSVAYTWQSVLLAAGIAAMIFICMTVYAWNTTTDFTGYGPYLFAALVCMFLFAIVLLILGLCGVQIHWLMILYDLLGVLLFTFFIVYDTQLILGEWGGHSFQYAIDDYAIAALNLYIDVIQLFLHLLHLFGERR